MPDAPPPPPTFRLYDKAGKPVDVPEEHVHDALMSGEYGAPAGTPIPVQMRGQIGTVPVEAYRQAVDAGARPVGQTALHKAQVQARYGDVSGMAEAAGVAALRGASLGASDLIATKLGGEHTREVLRGLQEANPYASLAGEAVGTLAPAFLTGGASEGVEGAALGAEAAEAGFGVADAAKTAARVVSAPSLATQAVGGAIERGIAKLVGEEATGFAGRLAQRALPAAARFGAEGAIYGGAGAIDESVLGDTELTGDKLLSSVGHGALLGALTGAGLATGGQLATAAVGELSPKLERWAGEKAIRALDPTQKGMRLFGENAERAGRRLLEDGVVTAGASVEEMAPRVEARLTEATDKLGALLEEAESRGATAQPKLTRMLEPIDAELGKLRQAPSLNSGTIGKLEGLKQDLSALAGVPTEAAAKAAGLDREAMLADASLGYRQARDFRVLVDKQIKFDTDPLGKVGQLGESLRGVRSSLESEVERAGDEASKEVGAGDWLDRYKDAKAAFQDYKVSGQVIDKALEREAANRVLSPSSHGIGIGLAAGALAAGHPLGIVHGLAAAVGNQLLLKRGNSTAAVLLDKLSDLAGVERAVMRVDRETDRAIGRIAGSERRVPPVTRESPYRDYAEKRAAVVKAASEAQSHLDTIADVSAPLATHAPRTTAAFRSAAVRSTIYLAQNMPSHPAAQSLQPKADEFIPSTSAQAEFGRKFDAVHDPVGVLARVQDGTLTPDEVKALEATHGPWLAEARKKLASKLLDTKEPIPYERELAAATFLGRPVSLKTSPAFIQGLQKTFAQSPQGPSPGRKPAPHGAPKRMLDFAGQAGLAGTSKQVE